MRGGGERGAENFLPSASGCTSGVSWPSCAQRGGGDGAAQRLLLLPLPCQARLSRPPGASPASPQSPPRLSGRASAPFSLSCLVLFLSSPPSGICFSTGTQGCTTSSLPLVPLCFALLPWGARQLPFLQPLWLPRARPLSPALSRTLSASISLPAGSEGLPQSGGLSWRDGKAGAGGLRGEALAASECLRVPMGTDAPLSFQISWARRSVGTPLLTGDQGEPPTPPILCEGLSRFPQGVDPLNAFPGRLRVADGNFPRGRKRGKPDWSISRWPVDYFFFPPSQVEQCKRG